ncbi:hypothetical protein BH09ACT6_BH09ACT6_23860 [soil metagenome]
MQGTRCETETVASAVVEPALVGPALVGPAIVDGAGGAYAARGTLTVQSTRVQPTPTRPG